MSRVTSTECSGIDDCPIAQGCQPLQFASCITIERIHAQKLALCARLEAIADDLPAHVDRLECLGIASSLVPLLRECHVFEEETVFRSFAKSERNAATVARLKAEHVQDDCTAQELTEVLLAIGHGRGIENPEALGYMLRGFFDAMRRHIAFERDHLLPALDRDVVSSRNIENGGD